MLSDYDGTLTPIVERPEMAELPESTREILKNLVKEPRIRIGIISGRAMNDLKEKVNIPGIIYASNHGLEIVNDDFNFKYPLEKEIQDTVEMLFKVLLNAFSEYQGVIVENKGLTLSVHYRQADPNKINDIKKTFYRLVENEKAIGKVKATEGKAILEVRPAVEWDKGKAIQILINEFGKKGPSDRLLPLYLGDDFTDEDAFNQINNYNESISIFVGENNYLTAAKYYLMSPIEVRDFMEILLETVRRHS